MGFDISELVIDKIRDIHFEILQDDKLLEGNMTVIEDDLPIKEGLSSDDFKQMISEKIERIICEYIDLPKFKVSIQFNRLLDDVKCQNTKMILERMIQ